MTDGHIWLGVAALLVALAVMGTAGYAAGLHVGRREAPKHRRPIVEARGLRITKLDADGQPTGPPVDMPGVASVAFSPEEAAEFGSGDLPEPGATTEVISLAVGDPAAVALLAPDLPPYRVCPFDGARLDRVSAESGRPTMYHHVNGYSHTDGLDMVRAIAPSPTDHAHRLDADRWPKDDHDAQADGPEPDHG